MVIRLSLFAVSLLLAPAGKSVGRARLALGVILLVIKEQLKMARGAFIAALTRVSTGTKTFSIRRGVIWREGCKLGLLRLW